jgi:hypothetical protein
MLRHGPGASLVHDRVRCFRKRSWQRVTHPRHLVHLKIDGPAYSGFSRTSRCHLGQGLETRHYLRKPSLYPAGSYMRCKK